MKKTGKTTSIAKKKACVSKAKTAKNGAVPPFAHRTPTQLHASTYALKRRRRDVPSFKPFTA